MNNSNSTYQGMYVTTCDFDSNDVISSSESPAEAYRLAKESGCEEPVITYVPAKGEGVFVF